MQNNKNKLKKALTASILVGIMTGSNTNAGFIRTLGELGGGAFALTTICKIGKNIFEKLKSTPIEECKISNIGFDNIYVFDGQIAAATFDNNLCFLNNLMGTRNLLINSSENGFKMYYGNKEQFSEAVEEINQAYINGEIKDVIAVNYFDLGNGNTGSLSRTINYYVDTKKPENKIKLQITSDTLFRFENANLSFKIKNDNIIKQLNDNMSGFVDNSVSKSQLDNLKINCNDIEIVEKPMEETYNLKRENRENVEKNARINDLKQKTVDALNKNSLFFCQVPNEDLVLIKLDDLASQTSPTNFKPGFKTTTPYKSDNSAPVSVDYPTSDDINNKNKNNDNNYLPTPSN